MIGIGLHIGNRVMGGGGAAFDVDAQAFFDRVTTAGGTLTTTEQNATNQLVLDMKSVGIWSAMKAIYPMVGASAAACAQNLKSSSFTGSFSSGWTFASTGVTPNGTSAYMDTGFAPTSFNSIDDAHLSFYSRSNTTYAGYVIDIGANANAPSYNPELSIAMRHSGSTYNTLGSYSFAINYVNATSAFHSISSRTSSTLFKGYKNGTLQATNTNSNVLSAFANNIYIGACNFGGSATRFSSRQCAFSSLGDGLTDTQASNFYTAVQAFQTTLNRYVDAPWYDNGNLLLDDYPSAAAAYSVRKLRNNYIGGPIRVRRSSDNAEQDIYFDANGNLDTAQLTTFCGSGNGFVTTWYDQSGNGVNFTQTTAGNQPQIVSSGSVLTQSGKPSMSFDGTTHNFDCTSTTISSGDSSLFITYKQNSAAQANILALQSGASYQFLNYSTAIFYATVSTNIGSSALGDGNFGLVTINLQVGTTQTFYKNNTLIFTKSTPTASGQTFNKLCGSAFGNPTPQNHSEIIAYPTNQIANRNAINTNITTYYGL